MAIIYSYPTVTPTVNDLVLGTDVDAAGKPTKNFTVQSIIDLVTVSGNNLQAVLDNGNTATGKDIDLTNNAFRGGSFITTGNATVSGTTASNFTVITSTDFVGDITGVVKAGSSIESTVTGVTQAAGDNSTKLATTAYVDTKVDPSVLQYLGDATGPFDLNLVNDDFKIAGTANQIITTATAVAGNVGTITLAFPSGGVTLPNGSIATTQLATDNSTKVATTAFVHSHSAAQDLSFIGDSGSGTVLLDSQQLDLEGTANQIVTQASGQKITFSLPSSVTISGTYTGTTFAGDLNGTINTATTGTTQAPGNNSTKIATTAYVDAAAGAKTLSYKDNNATVHTLNLTSDDLEFLGDSNITVTAAAVAANVGTITVDLNNSVNISGTMTAGTFTDGTFTGSSGTYTGYASITSTVFVGALTGNASTATALASAGNITLTGDTSSTGGPYTYTSGGNVNIATTIADTTVTGKVLTNLPSPTSATIAASDTILAAMAKLQGQITGIPQGLVYKGTWNANTNTPTLASGTGTTGEFYIVSVAGSTNLDGITDWKVGDWAIFVEVGATDTWQKIDNTSDITGTGTANKLAKWTAPTVLGTGLVEDNGTTVTIGNSGNLLVEGNTTLGDADADTTLIKGPGTADKNFIIHEGLGVGTSPSYGSAGQVLTSGGSAAAANTWTTPTTGTVTSIATNNGLTGGTITTTGTIGIDIAGTNNAIEFLTSATPVTSDLIWFSDISDSNTLRKCTIADIEGILGPYLPLAGGTMAGAINMGTNNITNGGTATFTTFSGDLNGTINTATTAVTQSQGNNSTKVATTAYVDAAIGNSTLAEVLANGNTTGGTDIAVSANDDITFTDSSKAIFGAGSDLQIYHDGSKSVIADVGTGALRIAGTNFELRNADQSKFYMNATDGGAINLYYDNSKKFETTSTGVTVTGDVLIGTSTTTPSTHYNNLVIEDVAGNNVGISLISGTGNNTALYFGDSADTDVGQLKYSHSTNDMFFVANATTALTIKSTGALQANDYGSGNNTGTATYNLEVDSSGNIIETPSTNPGGKGGTFNGDQAVTTGSSALTFTLKRATTGTLIFDVWFTSETSTATSVAKKYVVAHSSNTTPVYNKILDTGPDGSNDFTVTFANATGSATGDSVTCSIQAVGVNQNIGYTVQVGYDSTNALTFTAAS